MGNCLKKTKVVEPTEVKDNVSEMLSRGTPFAKPDGQQQADMVKDLKDEGKFSTYTFFRIIRFIYNLLIFIYLLIIGLLFLLLLLLLLL